MTVGMFILIILGIMIVFYGWHIIIHNDHTDEPEWYQAVAAVIAALATIVGVIIAFVQYVLPYIVKLFSIKLW